MTKMASTFRRAYCSRTYVCFKCMRTSRIREEEHLSPELHRPKGAQMPTCPDCGDQLRPLSTNIRVPKRKPKLWRDFKNWLSGLNDYYKEMVK